MLAKRARLISGRWGCGMGGREGQVLGGIRVGEKVRGSSARHRALGRVDGWAWFRVCRRANVESACVSSVDADMQSGQRQDCGSGSGYKSRSAVGAELNVDVCGCVPVDWWTYGMGWTVQLRIQVLQSMQQDARSNSSLACTLTPSGSQDATSALTGIGDAVHAGCAVAERSWMIVRTTARNTCTGQLIAVTRTYVWPDSQPLAS